MNTEMDGFEKKVAPLELQNDEHGKHHETRCKAVTQGGYLALSMIIAGVASLGLGIAMLTLGKDGKNPITSGFPITSGVLVLAAGCSALVFSSMEPTPTDDKRISKQKCMMSAFYYQILGAGPPTAMAFGYTIWGAVVCGQDNTSICGPEYDTQLILNIICIFISCINLCNIVAVHVFYNMYRKAFGICRGCCGCCQTRC